MTDLEAKVHGKPVKILSIAPDPRPHRVVLLLDVSSSMSVKVSDEPTLRPLEMMLAQHFFDVTQQTSQMALLTFNDKVHQVTSFSEGNSAVAGALKLLASNNEYAKNQVKEGTVLRDAIFQGIQLLDYPTSADAVFVLTDGVDTASQYKFEDLRRYVWSTSVRLFEVLLVPDLNTYNGHRVLSPEEQRSMRELWEIAEGSGGEILTHAKWEYKQVVIGWNTKGSEVTETLSRLYETIFRDYLMEVELPFVVEKDAHFELKFSNATRGRWKEVQLTYPKVLVSCDAKVASSGRN